MASFLLLTGCQQANLTFGGPPPQGRAAAPPLIIAPAPPMTQAPRVASLPPAAPPLVAPPPDTPPRLIPPPGMRESVRVGLLLPLSGPRAALGRSMLRAAQLALFEVADAKFILLPRDTGGTEDGARRAAEDALASGAQLLLGPVFKAAVLGAGPVARAGLVSLVAFTNDPTVAGDGVFAIGVSPVDKINRVVDYAIAQGKQRLAALIPTGRYGDLLLSSFEAAVARAGGVVVRVERYEPTSASMTAAIKRLANYGSRRAALQRQRQVLQAKDDAIAKLALKRLSARDALGKVSFGAILVPETGEAVKALAPLLPYYEIDIRRVRVLGVDDWSPRDLRREPALGGAWYAGLPPGVLNDFIARYRAVYKSAPHALAALAYDAVALAAVLAQRPGGPTFDAATLTARNGYTGSAGLFRLLPSGASERRFAIMQVAPDAVRVISPPPPTFEDLSN